jgi:hypothetical protein
MFHSLFIFSLTFNIHQDIMLVKRQGKRDAVVLTDIDLWEGIEFTIEAGGTTNPGRAFSY